MTRHRYTRQRSYRSGAPALALGCLATLALAGCIRAREEHCIFNGGDSRFSDTDEVCLVRGEGSETRLVEADGRYVLPSGSRTELTSMADMDAMMDSIDGFPADAYLWMPFGLPESFEGEPGDLRSVKGAFDAIAKERTPDRAKCTFDDDVVRPLWEELASYLDGLGGKTNVKLDASTLREDDVIKFNDALLEALEDCEGSGSETETGTDSTSTGPDGTDTEPSSTSSTTGEPTCVDDDECRMRDPSRPFCDPDTMKCVDCGGVPVDACAGLDPLVPLCVDGVCVACVEGDTAACDAQLLVCDAAQRACVPCSAHDQCEAGACDLLAETPTCFDPGNVLNVGMGQTYATIGAALSAVGVMALDRAVLRLHDGTLFNEGAAIDGRVIAFVPAPGDNPQWIRSMGGTPTLTVTGATARVYVDQLRLVQNGSVMDVGLSCADYAAVHVQRSHIVQNEGGGISASNGCILLLENTFVGGGNDDDPALTMTGSTVTAVYTTFFNSSFDSTSAIACDGPSTVALRNSIVVTQGGAAGTELDCVVDEASFTAAEGMISGTSNVGVGAFPDGMATQWFVDSDSGDFHLQNQGLSVFADIAQWNTGDPSTDIDGDFRPTVDGTLDYSGADLP